MDSRDRQAEFGDWYWSEGQVPGTSQDLFPFGAACARTQLRETRRRRRD